MFINLLKLVIFSYQVGLPQCNHELQPALKQFQIEQWPAGHPVLEPVQRVPLRPQDPPCVPQMRNDLGPEESALCPMPCTRENSLASDFM